MYSFYIFSSNEKNGSSLQDNAAVADDVKSNINGTILKRIKDGVLITEDQCEGDVLQMNGFNNGFYNSRYAEYSPENRRAIYTQRDSGETSSNTFNYGEQEANDHGDRDEDNIDIDMLSNGNYNSERDVYSVVNKNRRTTDPVQDDGDLVNSDNMPDFRQSTRWNKNTFNRGKLEEGAEFSEL